MYNTSGVDAIASITELRSKTSELIDYVQQTHQGVLIQKNNEPYAVLLDWETYQEMMKDSSGMRDRPPKPPMHKKSSSSTSKKKSGG